MLEDPPSGLFVPRACTDMVDKAEKAGIAATPLDPQPIAKDLNLRELAASEQMTAAAQKHGIMWARVKGFPHWPVCIHPSRGIRPFLAFASVPVRHPASMCSTCIWPIICRHSNPGSKGPDQATRGLYTSQIAC